MYFSTIAAVLAATAGLASAAAVETRDLPTRGDFIWKLKNFKGHRPKGTYFESLSFDVYTTTEDKLLFSCSHSGSGPMDERSYFCNKGVNDMMFNYNRDHGAGRDFGGVALMGNLVSNPTVTLLGTSWIPSFCKLDGQGDKDYQCAGTADAYINMVKWM